MTKKQWLTSVGAGSLLVMGGLLAGPVAGFASNSTTAPSAVVAQQEADGEQDPSYIGTIHVDDSADVSEDQEAATLQSLATITQDQAEQAALATAPGATVTKVTLDNENGWVVYSVTLDNGTEVKVDAGDGQVLATETDEGDNEADGSESDQEQEDATETDEGDNEADGSESDQEQEDANDTDTDDVQEEN